MRVALSVTHSTADADAAADAAQHESDVVAGCGWGEAVDQRDVCEPAVSDYYGVTAGTL